MIVMIATTNYIGAMIILGLVTLSQYSGASVEFDLKIHHDPHLLGLSKCLSGPSYWCKSMSNAVDCKAVQYCIQSTWRIQKHPRDIKGSMCLMCQKWIDLVLKEFKNHYSQDQLTKELDKVCDILLNPRRISHCKSRIDTVMPLIINSANVVVNSQSICFALQLCLTPLMDVLENEKEATINFEDVNTDEKNKQKSKDWDIIFKPEVESSFTDAVLRKLHPMEAVDDPVSLLNDQIIQKSEKAITVLKNLN